MAFYGNNNGNYGNRGYGNRNYGGGNNNQYQNNFNQQQVQQPIEPPSPEEFIEMRLRTYTSFIEYIKQKGLNPEDFAFFLGGWVTSYMMEVKDIERKNNRGY